MKNKSIIFMGTPEFAVSSLKYLIDENYNIIGVITGIDKKRGRGRKIQFSPIKKFALKNLFWLRFKLKIKHLFFDYPYLPYDLLVLPFYFQKKI